MPRDGGMGGRPIAAMGNLVGVRVSVDNMVLAVSGDALLAGLQGVSAGLQKQKKTQPPELMSTSQPAVARSHRDAAGLEIADFRNSVLMIVFTELQSTSPAAVDIGMAASKRARKRATAFLDCVRLAVRWAEGDEL